MIKRGISFLLGLFLISSVSAASYDGLIDVNSLVLIAIMMFVFYVSYFVIGKVMQNTDKAIKVVLALCISLFTIWKVHLSDSQFQFILLDLGLRESVESFGPAIFIIALIIAMVIWGFCGVMLVAGTIVAVIGYLGQDSGVLYNGWALIVAGAIMMFFGLLCLHRKHLKDIGRFTGKIKTGFTLCKFMTIVGLIILVIGAIKQVTAIIIIGVIILFYGLICPKGKGKYPDGASTPWYPTGTSSPWKPNQKTAPMTNPNTSPITKRGEASLDVIIGNKSIKNGRTTLDLSKIDSTNIFIKNGGTGGKLGWRAACNNELGLSKTSGRLAVGKMKKINIKVLKRNKRQYASVIINGRGGGRLGGRATRGRVMITFKLY